MTYISLGFMLAAIAAYGLYRVCPVRGRSMFLLVASYAFYCTWSWKAAAALACATGLTFLAGKWAGDTESPHRARMAALPMAALLTGYLTFLKVAAVAAMPGVGRLALPIGVSYYTFKLISYVMDVYWGKIEAERRWVPFAAYVAFFPQLLAGPIQRPGDFLARMPPAHTAVVEGIERIAWGVIKKLVVADQLAPTVNYVFGHMKGLEGPEILAGFYLFPLQLYADFSGLTDIAIGIGRLFGVESPENFNHPFSASTITEFWRRWHMSLTRWLADYVFTPLRMATRGMAKAGLALSIAVNMIAIGIWHGLAWTYFTFGAIHAGYLITEAFTARQRARFFKRRPELAVAGTWMGRCYVFHAVAVALLFFRGASVADAVWALTHLFTGIGSFAAGLARLLDAAGARGFTIGLAGFALIAVAEHYRPDRWVERIGSRWPLWTQRTLRAVLITDLALVVFLLLAGSGHSEKPFIYEGF